MAEASAVLGPLQVGFHHFSHHGVKSDGRPPSKALARFAAIALQEVHFSRAEIARIDLHENIAVPLVIAYFINALSAPSDRPADMLKGALDKFAHRMRFTGS